MKHNLFGKRVDGTRLLQYGETWFRVGEMCTCGCRAGNYKLYDTETGEYQITNHEEYANGEKFID